MFTTTDSFEILSNKISKPLIPVVVREGFSLTTSQMANKVVSEQIAELIMATLDQPFKLDIYDDNGFVCSIWRNILTKHITFRFPSIDESLHIVNYDDSVMIPHGIPDYLRPLTIALISYWL